jgi:hypothetical protein
MDNISAESLSALVVVVARDGRIDFVNWTDEATGAPLALLEPGTTYESVLTFPSWVSGVDQVEVLWVESSRFRGVRPQSSESLFSFAASFRPRDPAATPDLTD